ncbi:heterokaryon incompatibility protein-domain-containing protein [Biscogniauxia mediterranea]|nr:heterokaryon incompatibility protein-domain-containing protein [Biscogniauxia mediterranea]
MRLINTHTLEIEEYFGDQIPPYAILSHTWGLEELSFQEWQRLRTPSPKAGYGKIKRACQKALENNLLFLWCDVNCIDKSSSTELSEAVNSMFNWYKNSAVCYAYLEDVSRQDPDVAASMRKSRWFTRGWTLQELLAPGNVQFFTVEWEPLGTRTEKSGLISKITGIPKSYLDTGDISHACIAEKMSWLARRKTTRIEDMAYCMFGIFDLNMPLLYGEGSRAFVRLQEELVRVSNDHTVFCWEWIPGVVPRTWTSMLAPSARAFENAGHAQEILYSSREISTYSVTNAGINIQLQTVDACGFVFAVLNAASSLETMDSTYHRLAIPLRPAKRGGWWERHSFPPSPTTLPMSWVSPLKSFYVGSRHTVNSWPESPYYASSRRSGVLVTFDDKGLVELDEDIVEVEGQWDDLRSTFLLNQADPRVSRGVLGFKVMRPTRYGTHKAKRLTVFFAIVAKESGDHELHVRAIDHQHHNDEKYLRQLTSEATATGYYRSLESYSKEADATVITKEYGGVSAGDMVVKSVHIRLRKPKRASIHEEYSIADHARNTSTTSGKPRVKIHKRFSWF